MQDSSETSALSMLCHFDAGRSHLGMLIKSSCHSVSRSTILNRGRNNLTPNISSGFKEAVASGRPPHKNWSRGCQRARLSFSHFAWLLSSQLAQKKKKWSLLISRLRPSLSSPANTAADFSGRAAGIISGWSVLVLRLLDAGRATC